VHSAAGWGDVLKPVVVRYQDKVLRIYLRADAAFAVPGVYGYLEAERIKYAIRIPTNQVSRTGSAICSSAQSGGRRTRNVGTTPTSAIMREAGPSRAG
jgi:hypothetical protein